MQQIMKVAERENVIMEKVHIDEIQFGFVPGRGTTDVTCLFISKRNCWEEKAVVFCVC